MSVGTLEKLSMASGRRFANASHNSHRFLLRAVFLRTVIEE